MENENVVWWLIKRVNWEVTNERGRRQDEVDDNFVIEIVLKGVEQIKVIKLREIVALGNKN